MLDIDFARYIRSAEYISQERLSKYKQLIPPIYAPLVIMPYYGMQFNAALFYPTIQLIEVCLRNKVYSSLRAFYMERAKTISLPGKPDEWYLWMPQNKKTIQNIALAWTDAKRTIKDRAIIPGDVISRLTFGVWVSVLDEHQNNKDPLFFWNAVQKEIFPNVNKSKKAILSEIRWAKSIRNRLSHHEPLWTSSDLCTLGNAKRTIYEKHNRLLEIIRWMSEDILYSYASTYGFQYEESFRRMVEGSFDAYNVFWEKYPQAIQILNNKIKEQSTGQE